MLYSYTGLKNGKTFDSSGPPPGGGGGGSLFRRPQYPSAGEIEEEDETEVHVPGEPSDPQSENRWHILV